MNLLLISSLTEQSGSGKRLWSICRELGKSGNRIHFLERAAPNKRKKAKNVIYHCSPLVPFSLAIEIFLALLYNIAHSFFTRADIVFVLKPFPNSCIPALFKKLLGAKIIVDLDDLDFEYYNKGLSRSIVHLFYKIFPRHFDMITVHTETLKEYVVKELGIQENKVFFLKQGIDYSMFAQTQPDEQLRRDLGLEGFKVLVFAASLGITTELKDTFVVLKQVLSHIRNIKLLIIGGGSHLHEHQKMAGDMGIRENVVFTDYISHNQVPRYLALGDVALNYYEPNEANKYRAPIKIREYLALSIPVVCNLEGDTHLFSKYVWSFHNSKEYQEQTIRALNEPDKSKLEAGREFIAQNYDWAKIVPEFEKALRELLESGK